MPLVGAPPWKRTNRRTTASEGEPLDKMLRDLATRGRGQCCVPRSRLEVRCGCGSCPPGKAGRSSHDEGFCVCQTLRCAPRAQLADGRQSTNHRCVCTRALLNKLFDLAGVQRSTTQSPVSSVALRLPLAHCWQCTQWELRRAHCTSAKSGRNLLGTLFLASAVVGFVVVSCNLSGIYVDPIWGTVLKDSKDSDNWHLCAPASCIYVSLLKCGDVLPASCRKFLHMRRVRCDGV